MDERRRLLLAYAIAEWDSALTHLRAVGRVQPMPSHDAVEMELNILMHQWLTDGPLDDWSGNLGDWIIAEARTYLTEHQTELDQLLAAEGG